MEPVFKLSRQAAMLCGEYRFHAFLSGTFPDVWGENRQYPLDDSQIAAAVVRHICQVQSRSEFDTNPEAAARWRDLHGKFEAWKIT
jgi:hypothetical protein